MVRTLLSGLAALAALAMAVSGAAEAQGYRRGAARFPDLPVITEDGKTVNFYSDLIKGKRVVISFFYTNCTELCPLTQARLEQVREKLGDAFGRDVFFLSLSVDPEHDTPELVKAYAEAFDAGPGWHFVTGKPEDLRAITYKLGDRSQQRGLSDHSNDVILGNDATGAWQRNTVLDNIDRLVVDIRSMDPTWRNDMHLHAQTQAGSAVQLVGKQAGEALFTRLCAGCHTIGRGDRVGPDLGGVTQRREHDWLMQFIENPVQVRAKKDPVTVALVAKFPGVRMPFLGLSEADVGDLLSYIEAETARRSAAADSPPASAPHAQN